MRKLGFQLYHDPHSVKRGFGDKTTVQLGKRGKEGPGSRAGRKRGKKKCVVTRPKGNNQGTFRLSWEGGKENNGVRTER